MAQIRNGLRRLARDRGEWAGLPLPMAGHQLVIEPTYPRAKELMAFGAEKDLERPEPDIAAATSIQHRNTFWSWKWRRNVTIWELDGKIVHQIDTETSPTLLLMETLRSADAWGIEQEKNAIDTLGTLLPHRQFKQYLLTGMFLERSQRSDVAYLFRQLRPTLAITDKGPKGMRVLAALCMHPIGYYDGSWAGAMCPTDDVIAHLMLMRGDEHLYWRRANQHPAWVPQAGLG